MEAGFLLVMLGSAVCLRLDWHKSGEQEGEGREAEHVLFTAILLQGDAVWYDLMGTHT